jgi:hypothetical protein
MDVKVASDGENLKSEENFPLSSFLWSIRLRIGICNSA